jgi:hypothetical protein
MRRDSVFLLLPVAAVLLATGLRSTLSPVGPGDKIGTMTLVRGAERKADAELWGALGCDAAIAKPGRYRRTCSVPLVRRLFIGYGDWERTRKALDSSWRRLKWDLWFDGRHVDLSRFGTSERRMYYLPAAGGKNVILREWSVTVVGLSAGRHVIRYRSESRSLGTTDATWTFTTR